MNASKLCIFAEIDGAVYFAPVNQFHSIEMVLNVLSIAAVSAKPDLVKMPDRYKFQDMEIKI